MLLQEAKHQRNVSLEHSRTLHINHRVNLALKVFTASRSISLLTHTPVTPSVQLDIIAPPELDVTGNRVYLVHSVIRLGYRDSISVKTVLPRNTVVSTMP